MSPGDWGASAVHTELLRGAGATAFTSRKSYDPWDIHIRYFGISNFRSDGFTTLGRARTTAHSASLGGYRAYGRSFTATTSPVKRRRSGCFASRKRGECCEVAV